MSGDAGAVPDDVIDAVARVISAGVRDARYADEVALAVLSVPAVAEAFAKAELLDKVEAIVAEYDKLVSPAPGPASLAWMARDRKRNNR